MTTTLTPAPYATVGDLIQTYKGQLFRVTKVKQVNYGVVDEDGKQWNLRKTGAFMPPAGAIFSGPEADELASRRLIDPSKLTPHRVMHVGQTVKIVRGKYADTGIYVVLRNNGATYSIVKLGGDNGRYIRGIAASALEIIEL